MLWLIRKSEEVYFVCTPKKESCQHTQFVLENVTRAVMRLLRLMVMTAIFRAAQEIGEKALQDCIFYYCVLPALHHRKENTSSSGVEISLNVCVAGG